MTIKREVRVYSNSQTRAKKGDKPGIEGHAAVFNQLSQDLGGFRERVMPGAFSDHLATKPDVRCLFNHDPNIVLGRTKAGTLRVNEDESGLHYDCDPPDTQAARDTVTSINRGDVDQCSFAFRVRKQKWGEEPDPDDPTGKRSMFVREIHAAEVSDVSPVTYPAYTGTDVKVRALFPEGMPEGMPDQVRKQLAERNAEDGDCECDCARCQAGDCANCTNTRCDDDECDGCPMQDEGERAQRAAAKTKKVDGVDLAAASFAYVGDASDTSTWKLPIHFPGDDEKTKSHIRNALARFSQTKGIPAGDKDRVWHRIVGAAKAHGIKVNDTEDSRSAPADESADDADSLRVRATLASVD